MLALEALPNNLVCVCCRRRLLFWNVLISGSRRYDLDFDFRRSFGFVRFDRCSSHELEGRDRCLMLEKLSNRRIPHRRPFYVVQTSAKGNMSTDPLPER